MGTDSPVVDHSGSAPAAAHSRADGRRETDLVETGRNPSRLTFLTLIIILVGASLVYLTTLNPQRFGGYHDDSIYVTTAKAMASGQGYRIVSLPYEPAQTKYPPFYPFLLSLIWRANSHFPQNLSLMIWLSIATTLVFLAITFRYLITQGYATPWQASIVVAMTAFNAWTIVFSTSVVSEMLYAMLSVAGLYLAERYEKGSRRWLGGAGLGVVLGLAVMTRTSGISLVCAVAAYLVVRRLWRRALLPVAIASLFVIGWSTWCHFNRTTVDGVNVAFYTNYFRDVGEVIGSLQTLNNASKPEVLLTIAGKNALGLILVSIPLVCSGLNNVWMPGSQGAPVVVSLFFVLVIFMLIVTNVVRRLSSGLRLLYFYLFFYLALHLPTPYTTYDRYLVPLLPFLLLFLVTELSRLTSTVRGELKRRRGLGDGLGSGVVGLAIFATVGVIAYGYVAGIRLQIASSSRLSGKAAEEEQVTEWIMSHTDSSDVLICYRDPVYYLHTGRKATRSVPTTIIDGALFQVRQPTVGEELPLLRSIIRENRGRYLIVALDDLDHLPPIYRDYFNELTHQDPAMFVPAFESASGRSTVYRIENSGG
jgi:4-amino-4-deoxy-L-arabinose transferase-like glycosyltransferase